LIDADVAFHSYVHRLSGNDAIMETVSEQWPHFRRSIGAVLSQDAASPRIWAEHRQILDHIFDGNAGAAADAARRHIELATEEAVRRLAADTETS
jgi:DNA-binding GntR family transcriptional regulator